MRYILQFIFSAFAGASFGFIFKTPYKLLLPQGIIGGVSWVLFIVLKDMGATPFSAALIACFWVGLASETAGHIYDTPSITLYAPGLIPIVPGSGLYFAMLALMMNDIKEFSTQILDTSLVLLGISIGVFIGVHAGNFIFKKLLKEKDNLI